MDIFEAILQNDLTELRRLIEQGGDINAADENGVTPLHHVVTSSNTTVLIELLNWGADINAHIANAHPHSLLYIKGDAPLHTAIAVGNPKAVQTLLAHGADINTQNSHGNGPLHEAVRRGSVPMAQQLLTYDTINRDMPNYRGETPLFLALSDYPGYNGLSMPMHFERRESESSRTIPILLIEQGADLNLKDLAEDTLVHIAVRVGHLAVLQKLLAIDTMEWNGKNKFKETPLHYAARFNRMEMVPLLVEKRGDLEAQNNEGSTALHLALQIRNFHLAKLLVALGKDLEIRDKNGKTPLALAKGNGAPALLTFYIKNKIGASLRHALQSPNRSSLHLSGLSIVLLHHYGKKLPLDSKTNEETRKSTNGSEPITISTEIDFDNVQNKQRIRRFETAINNTDCDMEAMTIPSLLKKSNLTKTVPRRTTATNQKRSSKRVRP